MKKILIGLTTLLTLSAHASLIGNGKKLKNDQIPQVQALWFGEEQYCTASLIGANVIITAAHCAMSGLSFGPAKGKTSSDLRQKVVKFITHPEYRPRHYNVPFGLEVKYDIAIGLLENKVSSTYPMSITSNHPVIGEELLFAGTGDPTPGLRQYGKSSVISTSPLGVTIRATAKHIGYILPGDSGGPVFNMDSKGNLKIFGIVSTGTGANDHTDKFLDLGHPFTSGITKVLPSIESEDFLENVANDYGLKICGINRTCPKVLFSITK